MAQVRKVLRMVNRGKDATVYVQLEDGDEEYQIWIGGAVETYFHAGKAKAFVKKVDKTNKLM